MRAESNCQTKIKEERFIIACVLSMRSSKEELSDGCSFFAYGSWPEEKYVQLWEKRKMRLEGVCFIYNWIGNWDFTSLVILDIERRNPKFSIIESNVRMMTERLSLNFSHSISDYHCSGSDGWTAINTWNRALLLRYRAEGFTLLWGLPNQTGDYE